MWKKAVLVLTIVIAVILGIMTVRPSEVQVSEFSEKAHVRLSGSDQIPFHHPFLMKGLSLSGSWEGPGFAQVWLIAENEQKFLVMDTRTLPEVLEFSAFGTQFEGQCLETCSMTPVLPNRLIVLISGPGFLSIDEYHFVVPLSPSGLAPCPNCRVVHVDTSKHSALLMILLLVISVVGAHALGHITQNPRAKKVLIIIFIGGFVALTGVFGVSVAAPTAAVAVVTKQAASILAALAVVVMFAIFGAEMLASKKSDGPKPDVWKELEEVEEEWEKK
jgi:hypothetical protein